MPCRSMEEKKKARLEQVLTDFNDFNDRFPESKLKKQVQEYQELTNNYNKKTRIMSKLRRQVSTHIANIAETKNLTDLKNKTGNLYESIAIIAKRANQINISMKEELHSKLEEFATHTDSLEEIHENKEQIEISKAYERMPNAALLATQEFMEDKIYYRKNEDDLFS